MKRCELCGTDIQPGWSRCPACGTLLGGVPPSQARIRELAAERPLTCFDEDGTAHTWGHGFGAAAIGGLIVGGLAGALLLGLFLIVGDVTPVLGAVVVVAGLFAGVLTGPYIWLGERIWRRLFNAGCLGIAVLIVSGWILGLLPQVLIMTFARSIYDMLGSSLRKVASVFGYVGLAYPLFSVAAAFAIPPLFEAGILVAPTQKVAPVEASAADAPAEPTLEDLMANDPDPDAPTAELALGRIDCDGGEAMRRRGQLEGGAEEVYCVRIVAAKKQKTKRRKRRRAKVKTEVEERHGPAVELHPIGTVRATGMYLAGKKEGQWLGFHPDGRRAQRARYRTGELNGELTAWDERGKVRFKQTFRDGVPE